MCAEKILTNQHVLTIPESTPSFIQELNLLDSSSRRTVIKAVREGNIVAGHMRQVYGLWIDASNQSTRESVAKLKNEPPGKKMSIMMTGSALLPYVDKSSVYAPLRKYIEDPEAYSSVFGSVCHTVLPIDPKYSHLFPETVKSSVDINGVHREVVYNLDPTGHAGIQELINELEFEGIIAAVTSMNPSSHPEIVSYRSALDFLQDRSADVTVPILFKDTNRCRTDIKGSFPQVNLLSGKIIRDGHIPASVISWMLGVEPDDAIKDAKYGQNEFVLQQPLLPERNNPQDIRKIILEYIHAGEE